MTDLVARRVVVRGDVQGVFFRDSARREARSRNVTGWVRNNPDGAVEAVFEGARDDVERLVEWARSGPSRARVENAEVTEVDPTDAGDFEVR